MTSALEDGTSLGITSPEATGPMVHIRYEGQSFEYPMSQFDIGPRSSDAEIKNAVSVALNTPVEKLRNYAIDRHPESGNITLRPEAVFG